MSAWGSVKHFYKGADMSKRTKIVIKTKEAEALKKLREIRGLSIRKLADLMRISHTLVNHLEVGRANISDQHIHKFLEATNFSHQEWQILLKGGVKSKKQERSKILEECIFILGQLPEFKMQQIHQIMKKF